MIDPSALPLAAATEIQYAVDAIGYGTVYALMALSLALLFGVMGLMNFAYGELIMVAGYTMYLSRDWSWPVMVIVTIVVVTVFALAMERLAFRPLRRASPVTLLVSSFAVSIMLQQIAYMAFPGPPKGIKPFSFLRDNVDIGGVRISHLTILTAAVTIILLVATTIVLKRTMLGIQLRASTEDFHMAQLVGVRANGVIVAAFAITGLLAGAAGLLYNLRFGSVTALRGQDPLLIAFVGGVIGGLGSLGGAALGGFMLGALTTALTAALPNNVRSYTTLFAFLAVIAVLVFVPNGLITLRVGIVRSLWRSRRRPPNSELAAPAAGGD
ncbi:MAG: branched-chain amino acid ABC transporter permease [Thermoleophilia bacterium]